MNAFELNKIIGAVLAALVLGMGLSVLSDIIFDEEPLYDPAYQIAVAEQEEGMQDEEAAETPFAVLLASADPAKGESAVRVCQACHNFEDGGANGIGPHLHDVVGRAMAGVPDFNYSAALKTHAEEAPEWTYDELDGFLENPQGWVPGTAMGYAGIKDDAQRADVIAYLKSISPNAPALPEPPAAEPEVPADATGADAAAGEEAVPAEPAVDDSAAATSDDPFTQMVLDASAEDGLANAAVCLACHSVEEGQPHKLGPNIHGVYGRAVASAAEYPYSDAMKAHAAEASHWDLEALNVYLAAPMEVVPGTKMAFAGVKDDAQRAAIIKWLHEISPEAGPIVAAAPAGADANAAPAEAAPAEAAPADAAPAAPAAPAAEAPAAAPQQQTEAAPAAPAATDTANAPADANAPAAPAAEAPAAPAAPVTDAPAAAPQQQTEAAPAAPAATDTASAPADANAVAVPQPQTLTAAPSNVPAAVPAETATVETSPTTEPAPAEMTVPEQADPVSPSAEAPAADAAATTQSSAVTTTEGTAANSRVTIQPGRSANVEIINPNRPASATPPAN